MNDGADIIVKLM